MTFRSKLSIRNILARAAQIFWSELRAKKHVFPALLIPLGLCSCQTTLSVKDIATVVSRAYLCGEIDGTLTTLKAVGSREGIAKTVALRAEVGCDDIDQVIKLGGQLQ